MLRALGWLFALLGVLCLVVFAASYGLVAMGSLTELPLWSKLVGGGGVALIALWLFLDWGSLSQARSDLTVQRSFTASFAVLLALAVGVAANVVGHKYDERWDITKTKKYTLSQQSIDIAKNLDREVQVMAFFPTGAPDGSNFRNLLENYEQHSTLIKSEFHDPYGDPMLVEQMKITSSYGTVILKAGESEQRLESEFDEQAFTNALVKVTSDVSHRVCYVTGHGELDAKDDSPVGLATATSKLEGQNYEVETVSLLEGPPRPERCKVVVLAGPRAELLPVERDRLAQYVAGGGGLIVLLDPLSVPETAADLSRYGVKVGDDVVIEVDPNRQIQGGDFTYVALDPSSFEPHAITEKINGMALLRLARSVAKGPEVPGLSVTSLAHASAESWGETNLADATAMPQPDEGVDVVGNVPVAAVVEVTDPTALRTKTEGADSPAAPIGAPASAPAQVDVPTASGGKVVVFGDADFAGNQLLLALNNQDLFLNTVAWMVGEESQISIRSNEGGAGKLTVTVVTGLIAGIVALVVVPGIALIGAVGTWMRRRRL